MTVGELINKLSRCPNLQAQVKVRADYEPGPAHYTVALVNTEEDPVIVITARVDGPDSDDEERVPFWVTSRHR